MFQQMGSLERLYEIITDELYKRKMEMTRKTYEVSDIIVKKLMEIFLNFHCVNYCYWVTFVFINWWKLLALGQVGK